VIGEITKLNENPRIHGLLLRLGRESYTSKILNAVKPEKDVNGITDFNLARLVHGDIHECVVPPTARAVIKLLENQARTTLDGKKILLLGVQGPLKVSLQCLLQRKGVMTMSLSWNMKQLQTM
ncbi:monofunctional C1-tetrahydrofolate synthase, mitochondrial-like, partial [Protobothrops mucrosquamatus]|uniref:monofunctional C1-tetrahydrofolate synthase, mitochondrial-like n=1 Tax=Protobothrops mucrosquamatus TaxID=103944 RepID=UPI0010FB3585